jgi:hypothetical protein
VVHTWPAAELRDDFGACVVCGRPLVTQPGDQEGHASWCGWQAAANRGDLVERLPGLRISAAA